PQFIQAEDFRSVLFRPSLDQVEIQDTMQVTMQDTMHVTMQVEQLILGLSGVLTRDELQSKLRIKNRDYFRKSYLNEALQLGLIELTIPSKPTSRNQKYFLTAKGKALKEQMNRKS